ncbi:FGGY-family carbohydrate kinase [Testudinibacter sp. P80/BLE/0925]|uniref:FGGY-family carbohydrate kinase n=1 Tax=Testudinibacter sp. TW-1 TaxID=3417757 RepID=UPI003D363D34
MKYYLGLDCGGTFIKGILLNEEGYILNCIKEEIEVISLDLGYAERDMIRFWQKVSNLIKRLIKSSGVDSNNIHAIGISSQGKGAFLLDCDLKPLGHAILSSDKRADYIVERWRQNNIVEQSYAITCQPVWSGHPVSILRWIKENDPNRYAKIYVVLMTHDYLRFCLTGRLYCEESNISESNVYNSHNRNYDKNLFTLFDIEEMYEKFPPIIKSNEIAGYVTEKAAKLSGLRAGIPVVGGFFDVTSSVFCANLENESQLNVIFGTWTIVGGITKKIRYNKNKIIYSNYLNSKGFIVHDDSPTSAANLEYFIEQYNNLDYEQINQEISKIPVASSSILFIPFLYGSNVIQEMKSGLYGLQYYHSRFHILQAVYEGVIFSFMYHLNRIRTVFNDVSILKVMGGITKSDVWLQMLADITQLPLEILDIEEPGCLGAALMAMQGDNQNTDFIIEKMHCKKKIIYPNRSNSVLYQLKYHRYLKLVELLRDYELDLKNFT